MYNKILNIRVNISQSFLLIFIINFIFFVVNYGKLGMFFVDVSREVYIPTQINNGEVLYKDIFNIFTPLGYQITAFLTNIFGENLNTFYWIGFINSTIILCGCYLLLRFFLKEKSVILSLSAIILIIYSCVYSVSLTNYIFPYSYSLIFSLSSIIWALLALLYYLKKDLIKFLYISSLLYGISISFKYDFILFGFVLFAIIFISKIDIRKKIMNIILIVFPLLLSFLNIFLKGLSFDELLLAFSYISGIATSKSNTFLYEFLGFIPTFKSIRDVFYNFITVGTLITFYIVLINKVFNVEPTSKIIKIFKNVFIISLIIIPFYFLLNKFIITNAFYFNWIGIVTFLLIFPIGYFLVNNKKNKITNKNDFLYCILFISVILISAKSLFNISFNSYGTYYFPLLFITILIYISKNIKTISENAIIVTILLLASLFLVSNLERTKYAHSCKLTTDKGIFYISEDFCTSIKDTCNFVQNKTKVTDTVLVLPEGAMINFLTNRKSNNMFYHLIPPNLEALNEDFVVQELKNDLPNYLILQSMSYNNFNETYFCESFGNKICDLIPQFYEKPIVFGNDFWIAIYKKKELNEK